MSALTYGGDPSGRSLAGHSRGSIRRGRGSGSVGHMNDLHDLRDGMRRFTEERDWARFHDPKSLALALVGEVGELAELLQWLPADEAADRLRAEPLATRVAEELSDVLLYLIRLADVLDVDLADAATRKLADSEGRFDAAEFQAKAPEKG